MLVNSALIPVGERYHLIKECYISRFRDILIYRGEQPERIVGAICGMTCLLHIGLILRSILVPRIVVELDQRKSAAVMDLRGKHETDLVRRCLRLQMNYAGSRSRSSGRSR